MNTYKNILLRVFVKNQSSHRPITLIELLLVLALIALVGGVFMWNVKGLKEEQEFKSAVEVVTDKFQTAQQIMVILDSDVYVDLKKKGENSISLHIRPEKAISPALATLLNQHADVEGIAHYTFHETTDEPITFHFSALSQKTPYGHLELRGKSQTKVLSFFGYPQFIEATYNPKNIEEPENESALLYPKEVRELWQEKLDSKK